MAPVLFCSVTSERDGNDPVPSRPGEVRDACALLGLEALDTEEPGFWNIWFRWMAPTTRSTGELNVHVPGALVTIRWED